MIEKTPELTEDSYSAYILLKIEELKPLFNKINSEYLYWDKVKHYVPKDIDPKKFWHAVKLSRETNVRNHDFSFCKLHFSTTPKMYELLHLLDLQFGGPNVPSDNNKQYILASSIMEEAIASSQMEGASTTRKVAKELLKTQQKPSDLSQQMIVNNYLTIKLISEYKNANLTPELLLRIHKSITSNTLENSEEEGRFRRSDDIKVINDTNNEVVHIPPSSFYMNHYIKEICYFANTTQEEFIHPIIKGIMLHFLIAYLHPFTDGNGRTARALFYWFMLKNDYRIIEYTSISRIIYKQKSQYEKAFLYCENDDLDIGYFISYNLEVLIKAFNDLKKYIDLKEKETAALYQFKSMPNINERQAVIIKQFIDQPHKVAKCKDFIIQFNVSVKTIRSDLESLVFMGYLDKTMLNKRLTGYMKSKKFDNLLQNSNKRW